MNPTLKDPNNRKLPIELQEALQFLVDKYEKEDSWVRKQQIKIWKKNEKFWHGIQYTFWSESRQEWMSPADYSWYQEEEGREGADGPYYDYVVNIYKSLGETVIAALGAQVPTVRFPPDDAEDENDLLTSKTYAKIGDLIQRHNQIKVLQFNSLFTIWNQGFLAWYSAPKADEAFGTTDIENFEKQLYCPTCENEVPIEDQDEPTESNQMCPECESPLEERTVLDSFDSTPKSRIVIEAYGGLHVKVSYWAKTQKDCGYLLKSLDKPKSFLKFTYPHIADKIDGDESDSQQWERIGRSPSSFSGPSQEAEDKDLATHHQMWLRPWTFEGLPKEWDDRKKKLLKLFTKGAYVCLINKTYCESRNECMDDYWTIAKCGLSSYIHTDAMGQGVVSLNEARNVLFNLTLETIEQGIGSTFADPDVLEFDTYSKHEARPGMVYPARPRPGQTLGGSFFETGRATLSREVGPFGQQIDKDAQQVSSAFTSLQGAASDGKSRTLGEYQQSRQMALQRLQIAWALFTIYWSKMIEKSVKLYVENMVEDEKFTIPDPNKKDNYLNVWIRMADLVGNVGEVEPEGADGFPVSTPQKQALFFKLLELNNEFVNAALFDSENRRLMADLLGFNDLEIPGEDQRIKQALEYVEMTKEGGIFVDIDVLVDDHSVHIATCKHLLASLRGIELKKVNPQAYNLVEQHLQAHSMALTQQTMQPHQETAPGEPPPGAA